MPLTRTHAFIAALAVVLVAGFGSGQAVKITSVEQYSQAMAALTGAERQAVITGQPGDPNFYTKWNALDQSLWTNVAEPQIKAALASDNEQMVGQTLRLTFAFDLSSEIIAYAVFPRNPGALSECPYQNSRIYPCNNVPVSC